VDLDFSHPLPQSRVMRFFTMFLVKLQVRLILSAASLRPWAPSFAARELHVHMVRRDDAQNSETSSDGRCCSHQSENSLSSTTACSTQQKPERSGAKLPIDGGRHVRRPNVGIRASHRASCQVRQNPPANRMMPMIFHDNRRPSY